MKSAGMMQALRRLHLAVSITAMVVAAVLVLAMGTAALTGWRIELVRTGSMEPSIGQGSAVLVQPASGYDLDVGDVAVFSDSNRGGARVMHRVVEVLEDGRFVRTKGDASPTPDRVLVGAESVESRHVVTLARLGPLASLLHSTTGKVAVVLAAFVLAVSGELLRRARRDT